MTQTGVAANVKRSFQSRRGGARPENPARLHYEQENT
jgi:hypothetical protein